MCKLQTFRVVTGSHDPWKSFLSRGTPWPNSPLLVWIVVHLPSPYPDIVFLWAEYTGYNNNNDEEHIWTTRIKSKKILLLKIIHFDGFLLKISYFHYFWKSDHCSPFSLKVLPSCSTSNCRSFPQKKISDIPRVTHVSYSN